MGNYKKKKFMSKLKKHKGNTAALLKWRLNSKSDTVSYFTFLVNTLINN